MVSTDRRAVIRRTSRVGTFANSRANMRYLGRKDFAMAARGRTSKWLSDGIVFKACCAWTTGHLSKLALSCASVRLAIWLYAMNVCSEIVEYARASGAEVRFAESSACLWLPQPVCSNSNGRTRTYRADTVRAYGSPAPAFRNDA